MFPCKTRNCGIDQEKILHDILMVLLIFKGVDYGNNLINTLSKFA